MNFAILCLGSAGILVAAAPPSAPEHRTADTASSASLAIETANWIRAAAIEGPDGVRWPVDPSKPEIVSTDLYSGTPGVILLYLELHRATGDASWLEDARGGARALIADVENSAANEASTGGLYVGRSGVAFALHKAFEATGDPSFLEGANRCVDRVIEDVRPALDSRPQWTEVNDIIGGLAGAGLFLLYAADELNRPDALDAARSYGDLLISRGVEKHDGLMWPMSPDVKNTYPNFSHGTAGVAYFLASLHHASGDARYLEAAIKGARYLIAIEDDREDLCRIPRFDPDEYAAGEPPLYYVSWCHGPAGTGRLFDLLHHITGDEEWRTLRDRMAETVVDMTMLSDASRADLANGFWNNVGRCCGNVGVGQFMLLMHRRTGDAKYLECARKLTDDLIARGEQDSAAGTICWPHAEHRIQPDNIAAQTGLMQGAAGIGLWLLELDAVERNRAFNARLPDDRDWI